MKQDKLPLLIGRLESYAQKHPARYRLRVALLAGLGYLYLLTINLILLSIVSLVLVYGTLNIVTIKVIWIPLVLVGLVFRALWITLPEPDGRELREEHAPRLFELIKEVRLALNGPTVHRVLISDEFNAGIVQIPRFGMFGWLRNYLVVGLPLLRALGPQEFRSVLAHEFGHLSGKHGRFSGWIYRLRQSWIQILTRVDLERRYASFLFEWFLKWYAPFFNAYSFVLGRAQEYEADAYSVELAGREVAGRSLVQMTTKQRSLDEEFWPEFLRQARDEPQPPRDPFSRMLLGLDRSSPAGRAERYFLDTLRLTTGHEDTHPALADRLAAMGFPRDSLNKPLLSGSLIQTDSEKETAASFYLKELPEDLVESFDRLWREQIAQTWRERHNYILQTRQRLRELEEKEKSQELTIEEQWERVRAVGETADSPATLPIIRQLLTAAPEHVGANFALGAVLLEQYDSAGIEYLEKAIGLDLSAAGDACNLISNFHLEQGHSDKAEVYRLRAEQYHEKHSKQYEQATTFSREDQFEPHGLADDALRVVQDQIKDLRGLRRAYLVRKVVEEATQPFYVLGVVAGYTWNDGRSEKDYGALINEIASVLTITGTTLFVALEGEQKYLEMTFSEISGAEIFAAPDQEPEDFRM